MNIIRKLSQFRLGSLNVHFFCDLKSQSNVYRLAQHLEPLSLDVLALQEVFHTDRRPDSAPESHYHLKLLSKLLQLPYLAFCEASKEFGNAVLSRFPLQTTEKYRTESISHHNTRGMLAVRVAHDFFQDNDATLYVTHLDHMRETVRLTQLEQFEKHVSKSSGLQLLVGDFNSLTFDDYSDDYFDAHIRRVREKNRWEGPMNLVTERMKTSGYRDCWREMNREAINDEAATCVFRTRIDYVWRRGELKNGWTIDECRLFSTEDATDHKGVLIIFVR